MKPKFNMRLYERDATVFHVLEDIASAKKCDYNERIPGVLRPRLEWIIKQVL